MNGLTKARSSAIPGPAELCGIVVLLLVLAGDQAVVTLLSRRARSPLQAVAMMSVLSPCCLALLAEAASCERGRIGYLPYLAIALLFVRVVLFWPGVAFIRGPDPNGWAGQLLLLLGSLVSILVVLSGALAFLMVT